MATAFKLQATSEGNYTSWSLGAGPSKTSAVSDDSDSTYIQKGVATGRNSFVMADLPAEAASISGNVVATIRGQDSAATPDTAGPFLRESATDYDGTAGNLAASPSWTNRSHGYTDLGGSGWTVALVNACEAGVRRVDATSNTMRCSNIEITGNYNLAAGGYAMLAFSLLGSLIGSNIMMKDIPGMAALMAVTKRAGEGISIIKPHEFATMLREIQEAKHVCYQF